MRTAARAHGAGETGLSQLIEVHAVSGAADALVAVALAGSLFFSVPIGEARSRVALYLVITMAPFALLAPVVGPLLDRVRHGRRLAIAATLVGRGVLALAMARALAGSDPLALYPEAFGLLLCSKAYGVARSAVVPRLLPTGISLVRANSRLVLAGLLLAAAAAPIGGLVAAVAGPEWTLRLATAVFFVGAALTFGLPAHVDSIERHERLSSDRRRWRLPIGRQNLGPRVIVALIGACSLRALNGLLTIFLAFLLRDRGGVGVIGSSNVALGVVIAAAAVGGLLGTALGGRLQGRASLALPVGSVLVSTAACLLGALFYGLPTLLLVALTVAAGQAVSKLGLDSLVQREVAERVRSSAFSLSESLLQLAWVLGGIVGIVLPLSHRLGLGVATGLGVAALAWCLRGARSTRVQLGMSAQALG